MRTPQPLLIRLTHWINVPTLAVMAMSGLQIFLAYPYFGPRGDAWELPFDIPEAITAGRWLGGARHLHFAFAWVLVINAIAYLAYLIASGEYKRRLFWPPRDAKNALRQQLFYVKAFAAKLRRKPAPVEEHHGFYNGLQRAAYTGALGLGILEVLSGLALWKPVSLHRLCWCLGGYDGARFIHFAVLVALMLFLVGHIAMVALHPKSLAEMVTGGTPRE